MTYSENIRKLQPSATVAVSTLAKKLAAEGRDVINLGAGQPDFPTSPVIVQAAIEGIRAGKTRYTPAAGMPELRDAAARYMTRGSAHSADPARIVVSAGAKQSLFNACYCLFGPGDEVLVSGPYWTSYPEMIYLSRAESRIVWGDQAKGYVLSPEDLERAATSRTKGLILSTPSNPSGAVYSSSELGAVAEWAKDRGVALICDEIYQEIYYGADDRAPGMMDLAPELVDDAVVVNGMSKAFAMTGWRVGFSYTSAELAKKMSALQSHVSLNAATPSQVASITGLNGGAWREKERAEMMRAFRRRRNLVTALMDELLPDFPYVRPDGAFYLYFRIDSALGGDVRSSSDLCSRLLEEAGVAIVPGAAFGDDRFARMSTASSDEELEEGVRRMAKALAG